MGDIVDVLAQEKKLWHLCTPGELSGAIFRKNTDYVFGMNMVALLAAVFKERIKIYTFQIMSNHFHFVLSGNEDDIMSFFAHLYRRVKKFLVLQGRLSDLKGFSPTLIQITDIGYLRNVIAYVNRNGYVVDKHTTPFSYKWGANRYFFTPLQEYEYKLRKPLSKISVNDRRRIFHSHFNDFPQDYYFIDDFISPLSYINILDVECIFNNAHHYYSLISRQVETFSTIAKQAGDEISYTDEELSAVLYSMSIKKYDAKPFELDKESKIEMAKELHFRYNANNQQIRRVLRLDIDIVNSLFPAQKSSSR